MGSLDSNVSQKIIGGSKLVFETEKKDGEGLTTVREQLYGSRA